jgi:hypothetical protein
MKLTIMNFYDLSYCDGCCHGMLFQTL